jgi:acyl carrier protein
MSDVLDQVVRILTEVVGEDFLMDAEINSDTTFSDDLALESIEFVALAEKLQEYYGDRVNFAAFVADMKIDEIMGMTIGTLAGYIEARLGARP